MHGSIRGRRCKQALDGRALALDPAADNGSAVYDGSHQLGGVIERDGYRGFQRE